MNIINPSGELKRAHEIGNKALDRVIELETRLLRLQEAPQRITYSAIETAMQSFGTYPDTDALDTMAACVRDIIDSVFAEEGRSFETPVEGILRCAEVFIKDICLALGTEKIKAVEKAKQLHARVVALEAENKTLKTEPEAS